MRAWVIKKGNKYMTQFRERAEYTNKLEKAEIFTAKREATECLEDGECVQKVEVVINEVE